MCVIHFQTPFDGIFFVDFSVSLVYTLKLDIKLPLEDHDTVINRDLNDGIWSPLG